MFKMQVTQNNNVFTANAISGRRKNRLLHVFSVHTRLAPVSWCSLPIELIKIICELAGTKSTICVKKFSKYTFTNVIIRQRKLALHMLSKVRHACTYSPFIGQDNQKCCGCFVRNSIWCVDLSRNDNWPKRLQISLYCMPCFRSFYHTLNPFQAGKKQLKEQDMYTYIQEKE